MADHKKDIPPRISDPTFQDKDINLKALWFSIAGTLLVAAFSFLAMRWLYLAYEKNMFEKQENLVEVEVPRQLPPQPRLQVNEPADYVIFQDQEDAKIDDRSYGWIDKETGKVRISVERAMELVVKEGLPVREQK
ncbi:MAG: hypothetical protein AAF492_09285 [Verrucomicrobiota bacterium]